MNKRISVAVLTVGALLLACAESAGPPVELQVPAADFQPLGWRVVDSPRLFFGSVTTSDGEVIRAPGVLPDAEISASVTGFMPINAFQLSFWAVKGQRRSVQIEYLDSACESGTVYYYDNGHRETFLCPYLHFEVREGSLLMRPDGSVIANGDSVLITVSVDSTEILAHLEPSGLQFDASDPPVLEIWYTGADHDFNGDGVEDDADEYIQRNLLNMFTHQAADDPWRILSTRHSTSMEKFKGFLDHFSGFAVAY